MSTTLPASIVARVQRGMALLDEKLPGWRDHVDPVTLDLASDSRCILGQLFGSYQLGWKWLRDGADPRGPEAARLGFNITPAEYERSYPFGVGSLRDPYLPTTPYYRPLTRAWQRALTT